MKATPTGYFIYRDLGLVARWYWPHSTVTEVSNGGRWTEQPFFMELQDEPSWEQTTKGEVDAWLEAH